MQTHRVKTAGGGQNLDLSTLAWFFFSTARAGVTDLIVNLKFWGSAYLSQVGPQQGYQGQRMCVCLGEEANCPHFQHITWHLARIALRQGGPGPGA